jgi:caa(3)-type oxidase subunit IV
MDTDQSPHGSEAFREELGEPGPQDPGEAGRARRPHPSAKEYVRIGLILAVLTSLEVWTSYSGLPHGVMITLLWVMSAVKFALVVLWFMHLRFDDARYSRFFMMGVVGAATLYLLVLLSFRAFAR